MEEMKSTVVYKELLILSEKEAKAKRVTFSPNKNVVFGVNETGKSRVVKHILWALGCEVPLRDAGTFDKNVAVALILTFNGIPYAFYRKGKHQIIHDMLIRRNIHSTFSGVEWNKIFSEFFKTELKLQRHDDGEYDYAGPEYMLLSSYIDQDSSWGSKWNSFVHLTQFSNWQSTVFDFVTGAKSPDYLKWKVKYDEKKLYSKELTRQIKSSEMYHNKVQSFIPQKKLEINVDKFNEEIYKITQKIKDTSHKQTTIKNEIYNHSIIRTKLQNDLKMARAAEKETFLDINYLTDIPDGEMLECPTCGIMHKVSIDARVDLTSEFEQLHTFIVETKDKLAKTRDKETLLKESYANSIIEINELNALLERNATDDNLSFRDIVNSNSSDVLTHALQVTTSIIQGEIAKAEEEANEFYSWMKHFDNVAHEREVREKLNLKYQEYCRKLKINATEYAKRISLHRKPITTGSSGPRSVLALHCSIVAVTYENNAFPAFPFIIDTPQQSGQDEKNLSRMLDVSLSMDKWAGQVIIATESIPEQWEKNDANIISLGDNRSLLKNDEYQEILGFLRQILYAI